VAKVVSRTEGRVIACAVSTCVLAFTPFAIAQDEGVEARSAPVASQGQKAPNVSARAARLVVEPVDEGLLERERRSGRWIYRFHVPGEELQRKFLTYAQPVQGSGAIGKWPTATVNWRYNDAGRPAGLVASELAARTLINNAMNQWKAVCNVNFNYQGTTTNGPTLATNSTFDSVNVIGWGPLSGNTTGITGIGGNGTSISEGDIVLNNQFNPDLASTILHEVGHFLGLRHSDVSNVMMSGPPLTSYSGVTSLRPDDIAGCVSLFGAPSGSTPSIAGTASLSSGGPIQTGTAICANPSAGVNCGTGIASNGSFSCTVPSGWTGTIHLQAGNGNRVAARRYTSGITSAQSGQDFVVYPSTAFACNLDIDNNGLNDANTDGVMILRKLFGITGNAQLTAPSSVCAQRTNQTDMLNYLNARNYNFNSGGLSSQQEGLILLRLMLGMTGPQAVIGTGVSWASIQAFVNSSCGTNFAP
jgi:hypothetical protein